MKKLVGTVAPALMLVVAAIGSPVMSGQASAATVDKATPVVFVPGWTEGSGMWTTMTSYFTSQGYPSSLLFAWPVNQLAYAIQSDTTSGNELNTYVTSVLNQTGNGQIDIVNHSMGGLVSRYCVKFGTCRNHTKDWISLAGANHGTSTATLCSFLPACQDMIPGAKFQTSLNTPSETWSGVNWYTFWSQCDGIINPPTSTELSGATNTQLGCINHLQIPHDPGVIGDVYTIITTT